jgi:hypothetical protein
VKTDAQYFADWEQEAFGYGYGTGEEHVLTALRDFFAAVSVARTYDHRNLEAAVTPAVAWLVINRLIQLDVIEYGTSPRFGWLTQHGDMLRAFCLNHTVEELVSFTETDENYVHCFRDYCNCTGSADHGCMDTNPFWPRKPQGSAG